MLEFRVRGGPEARRRPAARLRSGWALRCTKELLALARAQAVVATAPRGADWCADLLWCDREKCLLLTHAGTLFTLFEPGARAPGAAGNPWPDSQPAGLRVSSREPSCTRLGRRGPGYRVPPPPSQRTRGLLRRGNGRSALWDGDQREGARSLHFDLNLADGRQRRGKRIRLVGRPSLHLPLDQLPGTRQPVERDRQRLLTSQRAKELVEVQASPHLGRENHQ